MRHFFVFLLCAFSLSLAAQNPQCIDGRYVDFIFDEVTATKDIKFGEGTEIAGRFKELFMDVYEPAGDTLTDRPVIVLGFGGSFISGVRQDLDWLCEAYARKGYVAVTIDYRLFDGPLFPLPTALQMQEVVIKAVSDMKGSIRYLRSTVDEGNPFNINPNMVIVGGISAGAIMAMHTAALDSTDVFDEELQAIIDDNGGIEGTTNDLFDYSTEVQGVINFSGGLANASWLDGEDPPFISVHDEFDDTVPYGGGFASVFGFDIIFMEGSQRCSEVGDSLEITNELYTIEGSTGHVSYFLDSMSTLENINRSTDFVSEIVCNAVISSTDDQLANDMILYPNPTAGIINWDGTYDVTVFNSVGVMMTSTQNTSFINIQDLNSGNYFVRLQSKEEIIKTQMIYLAK